MQKPVALWFDCCATLKNSSADARVEAAQYFDVREADALQMHTGQLARSRPNVLVFDFDYPDQTRLRAMQHIKQTNPAYPILMLTVQHSESLAVWSFRSRVWNYLVKPVQPRELRENFAGLARIVSQPARTTRAVQYPSQGSPADVPVRTGSSGGLQVAANYVEQKFRGKVRAAEVAQLCGMTRFAFSREFNKTFGMTFVDYVLRHRVREACRLLQAPNASVTDVAYAVGFNDPSYFGRVFKRYVGMLPSEYGVAADRPMFEIHTVPAGAIPPEAVADDDALDGEPEPGAAGARRALG